MKKENIHLVGIAGTGMAALAGLLKEAGAHVTGSDQDIYPPISTILEEMQVEVMKGFSKDNLNPRPDVAVIGNVIKRGNEEAEYILDNLIDYRSMPEMIKERFLQGKQSIVVAGTHGKTTTTSLLSWIFTCAGAEPGFLVGGIPKNFGKNYHYGKGNFFIIEGDEYETAFFDKGPKFMHYMPRTLVLGSIEYDHADIYRSLDEVLLQFRRVVNIVPRSGRVICCWESQNVKRAVSSSFAPVESFGFGSDCFWQITSARFSPAGTEFCLLREGKFLARFKMEIPGRFNVLNATAAIAASLDNGISLQHIEQALETFKGTKRRFEVIGTIKGISIVDDFAHHPTAIRETLKAARENYPGSKIWALVEPRSWSMRRNIFENDLIESLMDSDEVIIAPVYKAEQLADSECLNVARVAEKLRECGKRATYIGEGAEMIVKKLIEELCEGDIVILMSNGSFDNIYCKLLDKLSNRS